MGKQPKTKAGIPASLPILKTVEQLVDGFGSDEITEVIYVVDNMSADQTRAFRFPVQYKGNAMDVWMVIFMDDEDSPDVRVHAKPELIKPFEAAVSKRL